MNKCLTQLLGKSPAKDTDKVMGSLLKAADSLEKRLEATLEQVGLSGPKWMALTQLVKADGPLSLSELAAQLTCVRSNITQLVDRLEADGLVRRVEDPLDRRSVRAAVTPLGKERQAEGARRVEEVQRELAKTLSGVDCKALQSALSVFSK
ncbi:MAG TPA: MarR family transcriptional regulator [Burkholderiales bacterium]|nr:MarR family transcriptional regulator [Burkholderiales bacterium]